MVLSGGGCRSFMDENAVGGTICALSKADCGGIAECFTSDF